MLIVLCLLSTCFIQLSIGAPSGREDGSGIKLNEGEVLFEGDIILTKEQAAALKESSRTKRQVASNDAKWPNNTINYYYDANMAAVHIQYMEAAFEYIRSRTCVNFVKNDKAKNRLRILSDGGCASYIGFQQWDVQNLWFGSGCLIIGKGVHELMHALGVDHEHSRYDRDQYLTVDLSVVSESMKQNFDMRTISNSYNPTPFDYGSTMLYFYDALGTGSIRPKDMDHKYTMGLRKVSFFDMVMVNEHYQCEKKCSTQLKCKNGGYTNPANCKICNCPGGYEGTLCDQMPKERLTHAATTSWASYWVTFGDSSGSTMINTYNAYIVITAPAGKTVEIQITKLENFSCSSGCNTNGVEVKEHGDPRVTNPIFCCDTALDRTRTFKPKSNPAIIALHSTYGKSTVTYRIRYTDEDFTLGKKTTNGYDSFEYYE